jgi:nitrite reductase (NADH) large subunit
LTWDELVFATGSTPFIPPVPGHDLPHVHGFRRISDVQAILAGSGPVVVLGGGVLGVEAAAALRRHGDNVTLVNRGEWLMEQQLDAQAGGCWQRICVSAALTANSLPASAVLHPIASR